MLKKIAKLLLIVNCSLFICSANAELKVDIIAGGTDPISIAIQKFETDDKAATNKDAEMIRGVIEADLKRTGLFRIANHTAFPEHVKMNEMPNFELWKAIKTQVLVQAKLTTESGNFKYS